MKIFTSFIALSFVIGPYTTPLVLTQRNTYAKPVNTPEQELAGFTVPTGFVVELVASERDGVIKPIDLTFDDAGRLWTQTGRMYPLDPVADIPWDDLLKLMDDQQAQKNHPNFKRVLDLYQGRTKGTDNILIITNLYGKKPAKTSVWAEGLAIPQSILPYKNGSYVAQGSELFFLNDSDNDGKADERTPLLTGFGFTDTHTMTHTLVRAPANWIHFSHGALNKGEVSSLKSSVKLKMEYSKTARFSLDAKKLELVTVGLNNIWGFQLRGNGEWFGSEANDLGYSVVPLESGTGFPGIGADRLRPYQPWMPELHEFRVGGTGIASIAFADDITGSFPAEWKDVAFLANPITSTINAVKIVRNPDGTVTAKHLPDLLTSKDNWFRPVNMEFGPDGCLYVADWYNKIISHNEVPTSHPDRDKSHGRIWRIRHISQKPRTIPDFTKVKTGKLVDYLKSPSLWAKRAAWHQITDRPAENTRRLAPDLITLAADKSQVEVTRIHALWSLEGIGNYNEQLLTSLLKSPLHDLRREAVRSLISFSLNADNVAGKVKELIEDKNPMVRSQVLRTLTELGVASDATIDILIRACKPELEGNAMGGAYERKFERFLALRALEQYPKELQAYLKTPAADKSPVSHIFWAIQALPSNLKETELLKRWSKNKIQTLDESTFVFLTGMLANKDVYAAVRSVFQDPDNAANLIKFTLQNQARVQSPALSALLHDPLTHLLRKGTFEDKNMALEAMGRLKMEGLSNLTLGLINEKTPNNTLELILKALDNNPAGNQKILLQLASNSKLSFDLRSAALHSLTKVNPKQALQTFKVWASSLDDVERSSLAAKLSASRPGAELLTDLYDKKLINITSFDISAAERIRNAIPNDPLSLEILNLVVKQDDEKKKAFTGKLTKYMAIAKKEEGNVKKGETLFQTCLMCHKVGNKGQNIAPALDGSAARENEALLTAILNPDAAVESNYAVYRVTKNDGSNVEGYLVKKDERGSTIAFMGGSQIFIEAEAIKSQGFLGGRSFMAKGLIDNYSDGEVAHLLAYIKTLK